MNLAKPIALLLLFVPYAEAQAPRTKSLLNSDPDVVYLDEHLAKPLVLKTIKDAPVFSDRNGVNRVSTLKAGQKVKLEAITDRIYRIRTLGKYDKFSGWCGPWAFECEKDEEFVAHLKEFYERQMAVAKLIAAKEVAVGMTMDEVTLALGKPTKTSMRKTANGNTGLWEYVVTDEVKNYVTRTDPRTGAVYRQAVSVSQIEKSRTNVEFTDNIVSAVEVSKDTGGSTTRIVVPPLVFGW